MRSFTRLQFEAEFTTLALAALLLLLLPIHFSSLYFSRKSPPKGSHCGGDSELPSFLIDKSNYL